MPRYRRSSREWFKAWDKIISLEDKLSRVSLSERSGASVQTIKSLQKDWMEQNAVIYDGKDFKLYHPDRNISISLSKTQTRLGAEKKVNFGYIEQITSHNEYFLSPRYI